MASVLPFPEALVTLDAVARQQLAEAVGSQRLRDTYTDARAIAASVNPLHEAVRAASTQFTRRRLAEVVAQADPRRESANESLSYGHIVEAGLPAPELQVRIATPEGDAFPDFLWRGAMVIGEADGDVKYTTPDVLLREKRRQEALEQLGFVVVRWSYAEIARRPAAVIARILRALDARG